MRTPTAPSGFAIIARAARAALQWRLLLLWALWLLVPTILVALPVWQLLGANLDHSVHAAALAHELDLTALADLVLSARRHPAALWNGGVAALVLALLLSPLLSGMTISAARAPQPPGFGALMAGAIQEYPRLLRMLLWAAIPLGIAAAASTVLTLAANRFGERAVFGTVATPLAMFTLFQTALLLALAHATLDAGRAVLAVDRRRTSAVRAWWDGCRMLARQPLATFGIYLLISAAGLALAAALALARINLPPVSVAAFIVALALTEAVVMVLAWMRSARLFALIELARAQRG
jgi:hypothetical protein